MIVLIMMIVVVISALKKGEEWKMKSTPIVKSNTIYVSKPGELKQDGCSMHEIIQKNQPDQTLDFQSFVENSNILKPFEKRAIKARLAGDHTDRTGAFARTKKKLLECVEFSRFKDDIGSLINKVARDKGI